MFFFPIIFLYMPALRGSLSLFLSGSLTSGSISTNSYAYYISFPLDGRTNQRSLFVTSHQNVPEGSFLEQNHIKTQPLLPVLADRTPQQFSLFVSVAIPES